MQKPEIATIFLSGCFGCHMTLLDLDERLEELAAITDLTFSPFTDLRRFPHRCRLGIIEGGCSNEDQVHGLQLMRDNCEVLVAMGECAIQGDIPSMRNMVPLRECFEEAYIAGPTVYNPSKIIPNDTELPLLLDRVVPCQEVVDIEYFIPGCSPRNDAVWETVTAILKNEPVKLEYRLLKYD